MRRRKGGLSGPWAAVITMAIALRAISKYSIPLKKEEERSLIRSANQSDRNQ